MATALAADLELLAAHERSRVQRIALATRLAVARQWKRLDTSALTASWDGGVGRQATLAISAGQFAAAKGATPFVTAAMALQDLDPDASEGTLVAEALAGMASDGRPLSSLLYESLIDVKERLGRGAALDDALRIGLGSLERMVDTQVADAARVGISVASQPRKAIQWFCRTLTPPSCARCAILAGKITSVEKAFQRHPRCDCINLPIGDRKLANEMTRSPMDYFKSLSAADQNATFTKAGAQAIRDGSDIFQVVNARRGMSSAGGRFTTEGMTRRGLAAQGLRKAPGARRLTPEAIYELASDRDEAIRLLRRFGYLT